MTTAHGYVATTAYVAPPMMTEAPSSCGEKGCGAPPPASMCGDKPCGEMKEAAPASSGCGDQGCGGGEEMKAPSSCEAGKC